jgi:predicted MPP superfamily phosphohydrolase
VSRPLLTRRAFLRFTGASLGLATGIGGYTWRIEPHWLQVVYRPLPISGLPHALVGRKLVQISDVHVGPRVSDGYVIDVFQRVAALQPDIVVFTGDLISYSTRVFEQVASVYRHFPRGRLATLAILGNHDYGVNWSQPEVAQRVVEAVTGFGIDVLRNRMVEVAGLQIVGLDDFWGTNFDPEPVLASVDRSRPALALSHNPDTADLPIWSQFSGWILAGHTHGGQCKPPFLPPPLLPVRNRRYTSGEFALSGRRGMYINRGVGHLIRVRFNVRPEVTVFELRLPDQAPLV